MMDLRRSQYATVKIYARTARHFSVRTRQKSDPVTSTVVGETKKHEQRLIQDSGSHIRLRLS
jgi:hypothetical protein